VVIAGDSGAGKSTLACAMVAAGATLLGDEPVCLTGAQMWPGASALRAGPEEVERLLGVRPPCDDAGKAVVRAHVDPVSAQVSCILVLGPRRRRGPLLQRSRLAAPQALVPLIQHRYSRRQAQLAADMRRCAEVAQAVPVYAVSLLEDFDHVQVAAAAILDEQA
jgi:hypothetical protein